MRIALVTEAASGGVGRHVDLLARGLKAQGENPHVFFSDRRSAPWFVSNIAGAGIPLTRVDMSRGLSASDYKAVLGLQHALDKDGPFDLIHAHSSKAGGLVRVVKRRLPVVYSPHAFVTLNHDLPTVSRLAYEVAERVLVRRTDLLLGVSENELRESRRLGYAEDRVRIVPAGIETPDFYTRAEARAILGLPDDALCIGFVGRFTQQKRPERFVDVAARLAKDPQNRFVMIGGGELEDRVRSVIARHSLSERVAIAYSAAAWRLMPAFDVFAMTSAYEGLPYVLIEALYAGLPIVTDPFGGAPEAVAQGVNGYILPEASTPAQMAELIDGILKDKSLQSRMAAMSRAKSSLFDLETSAARTTKIYKEVLDRFHGL